ncbi:M23 family metallopeptidase [Pseudobacteroides cellulosolvens]|nr:M23 family metallopeptidase [Pseudobacteroides cellulosolvens]
MDNTTARGPYQRRNTYNRKKKKSGENNNRLAFVIVKQLIISLVFFLLVSAVMNFDSPMTDFLTDKVSYVMEYNVEINDIFGKIYSLTDMLKKNNLNKDNNKDEEEKPIDISGTEDSAIPASAQVYQLDNEDFSKIDYGGIIEEDEHDTEDKKLDANENNPDEKLEKSQPKANENNINDTKKSDITNKTNLKFIAPLIAPLGSKFGERIHPIKGSVEMHKGVDIKANYGVAIKAAMAGKVIEAGPCSTFGNLVKIDHQNGYITLYAHCSVTIAKKGKMVKQGDVIAKVGSTGSSTGPHLHFEIWKDNKAVNPLYYVKIGK